MNRVTARAKMSAARLPSDFDSLVKLHVPHAIRDEVSYSNTVRMVDALTSVPKMSKGQMEYLDTLSILLGHYEQEQHRIETSDITGSDLLKHLMDANELTGVEVAKILGVGPSAVSMILTGARPITAGHARKLGTRFTLPAGLFI